ncbi:MAG: transposase [Sandaracinus sp.]|nr:transposase [Sandaracinus sp.]
MAAAIPVALRERIVEAVRSGMSWNEAADEFKVGVATVNRLMRKDREGTSLEPLGHAGGQRHRIPDKDLKRLRRIVDRRPDATITELVEAYQLETGLRVGESTLARAMSRLGFSRKKRPSSTQSARNLASKKRAPRT